MTVKVIVEFHNSNPNTVWNKLAAKLGREPTVAEARADVQRILNESLIERAEQGKLQHQHRRA